MNVTYLSVMMAHLIVVKLVILISFIVQSYCIKIVNLDGNDWFFKDSKGTYVDLNASVPGGIYSDLMKNNIIDDIFFGYNDVRYNWVPRQNWTYYKQFSVEQSLLNFENVNVVFEGLDTFADIYVNNVKIGESKNMFVQYIFNIKKQINVGTNILEIRFQSPIDVALSTAYEQNKSYVIPQNCPPTEYRGECHVNMIRKMQASFSWDWGPSFPSVGIWKNAFLEAYNESTIRYIIVDTTESNDTSSWILNLDVYLSDNENHRVNGKLYFDISLILTNLSKVIDVDLKSNNHSEFVVSTTIEFSKVYVNTWWPNGYGAQDLYNLVVKFVNNEETEFCTKKLKVGFKTVEVIQDDLEAGSSFYFKINSVPIFMKGSNEIPINILPEKGQDQSTIKKLLTAAHDSHMNMLRIWGGGVYESEYLYELANELGILIWQDFMFACSLYPANEEFLNNVLDEVRHQVKRLGSFTSIALFSGNNENEGVLANNWYGTNDNYTLYKKDYVKLYIDTIKQEFDRLTHGRGIFISSSPTNGKESDTEGYVAKNPGSSVYGDVHYYNYILDPFNSNIYPVPRFASEYGYQSIPSTQTLLTATNNVSDLNINGEFMNHRQHHPLGNTEMLLLLEFQFTLPSFSSANYSSAFIFYSQIVHAMSTKIETEHYRRYRSSLNSKGEGYTMGALYWQLNDVWVAPTWAGIDYTGKWKMLHYFTQDFFAPIIITGHIDIERELDIYVVSDLLSPVENVTAIIGIYKWSSFEAVANVTLNLNLQAGYSHLIQTIRTDDFLSQYNCGSISDAKTFCFFSLSLEKQGVKIAPDNFVFPERLKISNLTQANVQITHVSQIADSGIYSIEISTDQIALFVWLDSGKIGGKFSENGFLQNTKSRTIYFYAEESTTEFNLKKNLTVTHLLDKQYFS